MSLVVLLPLVPLGLYLLPAYLLRRRDDARAQDFVVASDHTPPGVIQNSSIAYALKMATFGPFFAWGASGDIWPAIVAAVSYGLGLCLLYVLRRPLLAFLDHSLSRDQSITVHRFLAQQHGNDRRIQLFAAWLTLFTLVGLTMVELIALAAVLKSVLPATVGNAVVIGMLVAMVPLTVLSGNSGVMRAGQTQLGLIYFGLFGATAFLLYLQTSALTPMPPHATLAVLWTALFLLALVGYRRSRYIDTSPIATASGKNPDFFRRFEKILNVLISTFAILAIVLALMQLSSQGIDAAIHESLTALKAAPRLPIIGLVALILLPLLLPLADITNWQRLAALEKSGLAAEQRAVALRRQFKIYAVECPLMWLFMWVFGAIAVVATATPGETSNVFDAMARQLAAPPNPIVAIALSLMFIAMCAMTLSMMGAAYSANLCTLRYDILPALWPDLAKDETARCRTFVITGAFCLVTIVAFALAQATFKISFDSSLFLALVFAICCAQLTFIPLLLRPLVDEQHAGRVNPGSALAVLAAGCAGALSAVAIYLATGREAWLWAATPTCLGLGLLLNAVTRARSTASPDP